MAYNTHRSLIGPAPTLTSGTILFRQEFPLYASALMTAGAAPLAVDCAWGGRGMGLIKGYFQSGFVTRAPVLLCQVCGPRWPQALLMGTDDVPLLSWQRPGCYTSVHLVTLIRGSSVSVLQMSGALQAFLPFGVFV